MPLTTYLVGGYVRDRLLQRLHGLSSSAGDRDWVVVGADFDTMLKAGFRQVGRDFPVFLHPRSGEEYALARAEHDGVIVFSADVTLAEDLAHRDLTMNAMALDGDCLIDPYGGERDIADKRIRHIGPTFARDPLRVLRVARFAARLPSFSVARQTTLLMQEMVANGALASLTPERIWNELEAALASPAPRRFFEVLDSCGALTAIFPEVAALQGVPQTEKYHPEIDTYVHTLLTLDQAVRLGGSAEVRFAAVVHDLGKARTPQRILPRHIGHEAAGLPLVNRLCERLRAPARFRDLALAVTEHHLNCHRALELRPLTIVDLLGKIGALRSTERLQGFLLACEADRRGRLGHEDCAYPQAEFLHHACAAALAVQGKDMLDTGIQPGPQLGEALRRERARRIRMLARPTL